MPIKIRFFLILYFFINHSIKAEFVLASNNVTIKCTSDAVGATGVVNGKTYTKVNRSTLQSMINGGQDVSCGVLQALLICRGFFKTTKHLIKI